MGFDRSFACIVALLVLVEWQITHPFKLVGFYCNDPKLMYEYRGETISARMLFFVSFAVPVFVIFAIESLGYAEGDQRRVARIRSNYLKYARGFCVTFLVTDVTKLLVGEPRPHFFDWCRPQEAINCSAGQYFSTYTCGRSSLSEQQLADSYKSFPSGHASFSFYLATFFALYFRRASNIKSRLWVTTLQMICVLWAVVCSFTRLTDYRHHWWDVAVGAALGTLIAAAYAYREYVYRTVDGKSSPKNYHLVSTSTSSS